MGLGQSLRRGIVALVVAILVARAAGEEGMKVGLLTGVAVALTTWLSGRNDGTEIEFEDEVAVE
jgi:ribosomal protein L14